VHTLNREVEMSPLKLDNVYIVDRPQWKLQDIIVTGRVLTDAL